MNKNIDFVNGNTKKCLLEMTVPMIIAMFLNMAYNLVDSLWIGNLLGEQAYAALTNSTPRAMYWSTTYRQSKELSEIGVKIWYCCFKCIISSCYFLL